MSELNIPLEISLENKLTFLYEEIDPIIDKMKAAVKYELGNDETAEAKATIIIHAAMTSVFGTRETTDISKMPPRELGVFIKNLKNLSVQVIKHPRHWAEWFAVDSCARSLRARFTSGMKILR